MGYFAGARGWFVSFKYAYELDDARVVLEEKAYELDGDQAELLFFVVDALEEGGDFLGVEAGVDGGLVGGILDEQSA